MQKTSHPANRQTDCSCEVRFIRNKDSTVNLLQYILFMFWVLTTRPRKDHNTQIPFKTIRYNAYHSGVGCLWLYRSTYHLPPLGWGVNGTVSILYKYIGEAFHAPQRQTKSLKETSVSMILRSLRCWWWFTRKTVMVLCLYNSFQHGHSKRVPNYVSTTNNRQNWTIFECGPFHGH